MPSLSQLYIHIGATMMRFGRVTPRKVIGWNRVGVVEVTLNGTPAGGSGAGVEKVDGAIFALWRGILMLRGSIKAWEVN